MTHITVAELAQEERQARAVLRASVGYNPVNLGFLDDDLPGIDTHAAEWSRWRGAHIALHNAGMDIFMRVDRNSVVHH